MQLIIITHDEEFVNVMKQSLSMQVGIVVVELKLILSFLLSLPSSFIVYSEFCFINEMKNTTTV